MALLTERSPTMDDIYDLYLDGMADAAQDTYDSSCEDED